MRLLLATIAAVALLHSPSTSPAAEEAAAKAAPENAFFALCVSTHDPQYRTPADQAKLLKELGYAGMAHVWLNGAAEAAKAADDNGLKLYHVYIRASLDPNRPKYDPRMKEVIASLKGHDTTLGLLVQGAPPSAAEHDERAVEIIREIAAMAEEAGLRVALYPHTGDWLERVEDAVRVAKKVDRKNVGVIFNLCHWLAVDEKKDYKTVLQAAAPHLFGVTLNGAEKTVTRQNRQGWIQTLDRGSFDNAELLATLREVGYTGPVGLQCYGIQGDVRDNLTRSMAAWRKISGQASKDERAKQGLTNPFFAFDNGTGRGRLSPEVQAQMLADLGYAGMGYTGTGGIPDMLAALKKHDLKMFSTYVGARVGPDGPSYDPNLKQAIEQLKGHDTLIWLTVTGNAPDAEKQAVAVVREIGDLAAASGLKVALYPHLGFYVERVEDAVRIVKQVDRTNVGASFNLCHWLKVGDEPNMEQRLKESMPYLFAVSINGADHEGGWDRLIQTLDRGEFDVLAFLKRLNAHDYTGPIGLQCYAIKGDTRENLTRSINAWKKFVAEMAP